MIANINTEHILSVKAYKAKPESCAAWREPIPGVKLLFFLLQKPCPGGYGYERVQTPEEWIKYQLNTSNRFTIVDNQVFLKARVVIEYLGGKYTSSEIQYFDTDELAIKYLETVSNNFSHITIGSWEEQ